jgi:hypothetical protein
MSFGGFLANWFDPIGLFHRGSIFGDSPIWGGKHSRNRENDAASEMRGLLQAAQKSASTAGSDNTAKILNTYNYNGLNDSATGRTLFNTTPVPAENDPLNPLQKRKPLFQ